MINVKNFALSFGLLVFTIASYTIIPPLSSASYNQTSPHQQERGSGRLELTKAPLVNPSTNINGLWVIMV
jgi:hypothetical protein